MRLSQIQLEQLAVALARSDSFNRLGYSFSLVQLLAKGEPVSRAAVAATLQRPVAEVAEALRQFEDIIYDEQGRIVGAGLSLLPTGYRFEVPGHALYTWCALDTLIFPVWLGLTAQVFSLCPVTGILIHLRVSPEGVEQLEPPSAVLSLLMQDGLATCCNIRDAFCAYSQFFADPQAASVWQAQTPSGRVLSIEEAFYLGQTLARHTRPGLQDGET
jgi:alkylmercury lyase